MLKYKVVEAKFYCYHRKYHMKVTRKLVNQRGLQYHMTIEHVGEHYTVGDLIGSGGMGQVYRGTDKRNNQPVAIKKLHGGLKQSDDIERFKREGQALRDLDHPNIVKLIDMLEVDGAHYLVMDYIAGGDLKHLLDERKLTLDETLRMMLDLADALTRAHKLGIIHRDLKPANVLIDGDGVLRLTDFGVALIKQRDRISQTGSLVGSIDYLPPEAINGEEPDARTDIWAFGVMLFEMVSGQHPFGGETITERLMNIINAPMPDLETMQPDLPVTLVDLIYRMLERDSLSRLNSVRYIGAVLESIQNRDEIVPAYHTTQSTDFEVNFSAPRLTNLPTEPAPFVGREQEIAALLQLIADSDKRLITVMAPGGMGKTRLAIEVARRHLALSQKPVFLIELASISSPNDVISMIANELGLILMDTERKPLAQLVDYLRGREMLLVLDNFEHVIEAAPDMFAIVKGAPSIDILITSRKPLNQSNEIVFSLDGLVVEIHPDVATARSNAVIQLFLQGAKRVQPSFELTDGNVQDIGKICSLTQGMPLAILLAAGWVNMLSLSEIVEEMENSLDILETDLNDVPERQRSMQAIFDYTWGQMDPKEQDVFTKLSVFRGGFTREAAQAVAEANLRVLKSLADKSIIRRDANTGRYYIHELLRQYAEAQLSSEASAHTKEAHRVYFATMVGSNWAQFASNKQPQLLAAINADLSNILMAWDATLIARDVPRMQEFVDIMGIAYDINGRYQDCIEFFKRGLATTEAIGEEADAVRASIMGWLAEAEGLVGHVEQAVALCEKAYTLYSSLTDKRKAYIGVYEGYVMARLYDGQYEKGIRAAQEWRSEALKHGDTLWVGISHNMEVQ